MKVNKCDRCQSVGGKNNVICLYSWRIKSLFGRKYDLCDNCYLELIGWLKIEK